MQLVQGILLIPSYLETKLEILETLAGLLKSKEKEVLNAIVANSAELFKVF